MRNNIFIFSGFNTNKYFSAIGQRRQHRKYLDLQYCIFGILLDECIDLTSDTDPEIGDHDESSGDDDLPPVNWGHKQTQNKRKK